MIGQYSRLELKKMAAMNKKESILDLNKYIDQGVRVKFQGGREVMGILKGYDQLVNLVLDDTIEFLRDMDDPYRLSDETRTLGMVVCRGTQVSLISPAEGFDEIPNPFIPHHEEQEE